MKMKITLILAALSASTLAHAAVTAEEAARLGKDLTPWGAEKAGNKEGTIPPYTGGMARNLMGAGYDSNKYSDSEGYASMPDPFKDEKPLYTITAKNLDQYADKLSEATKALFKVNPNFYMNVYPSHRVVNPPKFYQDESVKNATLCITEKDGEALKSCKGGVPFPIPKTAKEAMWNFKLATFPGIGGNEPGGSTQYYTDRNGQIILTGDTTAMASYVPYHDPRISREQYEGDTPWSHRFYMISFFRTRPARIVGEGTALQYFTDGSPNAGWGYQPGNRRVRVSPNVNYDYPVASAGGSAYYDELNVFQGKMDKFDWKLIGKKEMLLPYSNYKLLHSRPAKAMMPLHFNPELTRWELHRVWVVEATRKPNVRHAFAKRRYYNDEDYSGAQMADQFDDSGKVVRGGYQSALWVWDYQQQKSNLWLSDLLSGVLVASNFFGDTRPGKQSKLTNPDKTGAPPPISEVMPEALLRGTQR